MKKKGIWLIGAYGDIATTLIVGKEAIKQNLTSNVGLVSELEPMNQLGLSSLNDFVIGGHDVVDNSLLSQAELICERSRTFSFRILGQMTKELEAIDQNIRVTPEFNWNPNDSKAQLPTLSELSEKFRQMLRQFADENKLEHVTVVNLASAEAYTPIKAEHHDYSAFIKLMADNDKKLISPSMLYAYSAFMEDFSFVNFTPNTSASIGALNTLAVNQSVPYCGNDGKTGETLVKTALAPMYAARNLKIMSWTGLNLLGNGDGETLHEPEHCKNKIKNKEAVLPAILDYSPQSIVDIKYVPSLGDWKTAWDLIHFQGFLDVPMTMQFTWQGCDSILAAPLVLDMVRFTEFAHRNNESGAKYS